ncbi:MULTISPECIES: hypothetical protein [unclassified Paraburkholderia]|uniref:hypothetical protein n=1 Tax=unclassified Paraburkholderia TaxID=2615204 RepID=UPI002AB1B3CA|nr:MULTISPECIES: hypothetical protein [unclassified Paraburkholderia]
METFPVKKRSYVLFFTQRTIRYLVYAPSVINRPIGKSRRRNMAVTSGKQKTPHTAITAWGADPATRRAGRREVAVKPP